MRAIGYLPIRLLYRIKIEGTEHLPKKGAVILCANHISFFDPVALVLCTRRTIHFMAKSEFFTDKGAFVRLFMRACAVIPVKRSTADKNSVSAALDCLQKGGIVGIFPQGKIVKDNTFQPKAGCGLLAVKTGTPVVPIWLETQGKVRLFSRIRIRIGEPLTPPTDSSLGSARTFTQVMTEKMIALSEE